MIRRIFASLLCALTLGAGLPAIAEPTAAPTSQPSIAAVTADEYIKGVTALMDERGIVWRHLDSNDPYTLIVNSTIILEVIQTDGAISSIALTAQGDFSALSGEIISTVLTGSIAAYSAADASMVWMDLIDMISSAGGTEYAYGLGISLAITNEAIEMTLTPSDDSAATGNLLPPPARRIIDMDGLIKYCAALLPDGWTQTSYQNSGERSDVLLNIYAASDDADALWDCAHTINASYWRCVKEYELQCDRMSIVFYSSGMTPMLSLGISRADATDNPLLGSDATVDEFKQEFERLASESDALVISYD